MTEEEIKRGRKIEEENLDDFTDLEEKDDFRPTQEEFEENL